MVDRRLGLVAALLMAASCYNPPAEKPQPVATAKKDMAPKVMTVTSSSPEALAAFETGRDLAENIRQAEALESFKKALELDPNFAMARAYTGWLTPGAEGMADLEQASAAAANLPAAERAFIESMAAERRGEDAQALELLRKAAMAAPDDWRVQFALSQRLWERYMLDEAATALTTATTLNPSYGAAHNMLGYVHLMRGNTDGAIAAFQKYASVSPTEPNPHDSLGEALMAAGRHDEAEAAYQKALATSPAFFPAWVGIAQSRFIRGDYTGGREALGKAKESATRPIDKAEIDEAMIWAYMAEGKSADALKAIDALEANAKAAMLSSTYSFAPIERARILIATGKAAEAGKHLDEAMARGTAAPLPGGPMNNLRREMLATQIGAQAMLGQSAEATTTLAAIEAEAATAPDNRRRQSMLAYARGEAAMAANDPTAAAAHFKQCIAEDAYCHLREAAALKAAGDAAGSEAVLQSIMSVGRRYPDFLWVYHQAKSQSTGVKATATN